MKFLDVPQFNRIIELLGQPLSGVKLDIKLESYSCKMVAADKKMFKEMSANMKENLRLSGPQLLDCIDPSTSPSSYCDLAGEMSEGAKQPEISVKTLSYLIGTLNQAFADNDFRDADPSGFCRELDFQYTQRIIDEKFERLVSQYSSFKQDMWNIISQEIDMPNCDIYSYKYKDDPYFDNCLWYINVFFFNKGIQRIVFLSARFLTDEVDDSYDHLPDLSDDCEEYGFTQDA